MALATPRRSEVTVASSARCWWRLVAGAGPYAPCRRGDLAPFGRQVRVSTTADRGRPGRGQDPNRTELAGIGLGLARPFAAVNRSSRFLVGSSYGGPGRGGSMPDVAGPPSRALVRRLGRLRSVLALGVVAGLVALTRAAPAAGAQPGNAYHQTNLVSDLPGLAQLTDPDLVNPWGLAAGPTTPAWVA